MYEEDDSGNNVIELGILSIEKRRMLDECTVEPKFYTIILRYEILNDFICYVIEYGSLLPSGKSVLIKNVRTRYSKLLELYENLKSNYSKNLPSFPAKQWWGNVNEQTAKYRVLTMNPFVKILNQFPGIYVNKYFVNIFSR